MRWVVLLYLEVGELAAALVELLVIQEILRPVFQEKSFLLLFMQE